MVHILKDKPCSGKNRVSGSRKGDLFTGFHYLVDYRINRFQVSPWTHDE